MSELESYDNLLEKYTELLEENSETKSENDKLCEELSKQDKLVHNLGFTVCFIVTFSIVSTIFNKSIFNNLN